MPISPVCVDANVVVKLVSPEEDRPLALALWELWLRSDMTPVAPYLLLFEVTSALWRKSLRGLLTVAEARQAVEVVLGLGVQLMNPPDLSLHAFDLAARFNPPAAYDAHYLALAESLGCEFWTADERLYNAVQTGFSTIRWLGNYQA